MLAFEKGKESGETRSKTNVSPVRMLTGKIRKVSFHRVFLESDLSPRKKRMQQKNAHKDKRTVVHS